MDPQQPPVAQQGMPPSVWAPIYGAAFMNQCVHPQLQQLADAQWKLELSAKLAAILEKLREKFARTQNVCLCQTWVGADGGEGANPSSLEVTLWADPRLAIVLDPLFQDLRNKSCQGPVFFRNSMPGKVWRSGAVQIVQNLRILPPSLHPRSQLSEEALERLAEALYIPIYDLARPAKGQVCVLEVLLSTRATEAMLVADVISFIGSLLTALQLSLANPVQQPVRRSVLCGRRARAPDSDEGEASGEEGPGAAAQRAKQVPAQQQQQQAGTSVQGTASAAGEGCQASTSTPPGTGGQQQEGCRGTAPHGNGAVASNGLPGGQSVRPDGAALLCPSSASARGVGEGPAAHGPTTAGEPQAQVRPADPHAVVCRGGGEAVPACSEQPTLPASPSSQDRPSGRVAPEGAAADVVAPGGAGASTRAPCSGVPAAAEASGADCAGGVTAGGGMTVPRKVRKLLDGPMQRTKSVVSVATLSDGLSPDDEEDEDPPPP